MGLSIQSVRLVRTGGVVGYGIIGFVDDYRKVVRKDPRA